MPVRFGRCRCIGVLLAALPTGVHGAAVAQEADIVITAQRRAERLADVPIAVTAISADEIARRQFRRVDDLGAIVPNLIATGSSGGQGNARIFLRGMGQAETIMPTAEPAVGLYVDDVYLARINGSNLDLVDVDRIEVLRGPQGTLYGRNTMGGAIRIITRQPDRTTDGDASLSYGSHNRIALNGRLSGPVGGEWAASIAVGFNRLDGDVRRFIAKDVPTGRKLGDRDFEGGRASLRYFGWDRGELVLSAYASRDDGEGVYLTPIGLNTGLPALTGGGIHSTLTVRDVVADTGQFGGSLKWTRDLGGAEIKATTAYRHVANTSGVDVSGRNAWYIDSRVVTSEVSQEVLASGNGLDDRLDWIAGTYFLAEKGRSRSLNSIGSWTSLQRFRVTTRSIALFGQVRLRASHGVALTLGGRYTSDRKSFNGTTVNTAPMWRDGAAVLRRHFSQFTPRFGVDVEPHRDMLVYASVAKGFKAGGFQGRAFSAPDLTSSYEPETVWTHEIGAKAELWNRAVRLNLAHFWNRFHNLQLNTFNMTSGGGTIIQNAAGAHSHGLEAELAVRPDKGLDGYVNVSTLTGRYTRLDPSVADVALSSKLAAMPRLTVQAGLDYSAELGGSRVAIGVGWQHVAAYYPGTSNRLATRIPKVDLINAHFAAGPASGRWSVTVSGRNLTNRRYWLTGFAMTSFSSILPAEGRTLNMRLAYRL